MQPGKQKRTIEGTAELKGELIEKLRVSLSKEDIRVRDAPAGDHVVLPVEFDSDPSDPVVTEADQDPTDPMDSDPTDPLFPPGV